MWAYEHATQPYNARLFRNGLVETLSPMLASLVYFACTNLRSRENINIHTEDIADLSAKVILLLFIHFLRLKQPSFDTL